MVPTDEFWIAAGLSEIAVVEPLIALTLDDG
jgi:hypothetical protein